MRSSLYCRQCESTRTGRNNGRILSGLDRLNWLSRQGNLAIFALLLVLLNAGLLTSNTIGLFGGSLDAPANVATRPEIGNSTDLHPATESKDIDTLLKVFKVHGARRERVAQAILQSSRKYNLDPRLVASIIIVESRGNPFAISESDAVGVMQIHVPTWARTVDEEGIDLFNIEDNVDLGTRILRDYVERYGRDEGVKRYIGWRPGNAASLQNAEGYLRKVLHVYFSS
jgi:hypothetical protein